MPDAWSDGLYELECLNCGWDGSHSNLTVDFPGWKIPLRSGFVQFRKSADQGCVRCKIIIECWKTLGSRPRFASSVAVDAVEYDGSRLELEEASRDVGQQSWELFHLVDSGGHPSRRLAGFKTYETLPSGDTSSNKAFEWAVAQLQLCEQSHLCYSATLLSKPTRILDVRAYPGSMDVKLIDGKRISGARYVALSHCWGAFDPPCKTTKATIAARRAGIPLNLLPRSFQEAVVFTRKLKIRYLWIDTLCIVQDDIQDWLQESGRMHDVYKNSYLTIAAASSHDSRGGIFTTTRKPVKITTLVDERYHYNIFARPLFNHIFSGTYRETNEDDLPILTRGWVFQERLLSPRVLYFTKTELVWECHESCNCECGQFNIKATTSSHAKHQFGLGTRLVDPYGFGGSLRYRPSTDPMTRAQKWHNIVTEYSDLQLTKNSDNLPALAGVAQEMCRFRAGEKYLAGLWSGSIYEDLMWRTARLPGQPHHPGRWRPPSWSWASVPTTVFFPYHYHEARFLYKVRHASCQLVSSVRFGPVTGGRLVLQARILPGVKATGSMSLEESLWYMDWIIEHDSFKLELEPDRSIEELAAPDSARNSVENLTLLACAVTITPDSHRRIHRDNHSHSTICLVLYRHNSSRSYQRVGLATLDTDSMAGIEEFYKLFSRRQDISII